MTYGTDELRAAYLRNNRNAAATARELKIPVTTLKDRLQREGFREALVAPEGHIPTFGVSKVSTLYNADGDVTAQWVQQKPEADAAQEALAAAVDAMCETIPAIKPVPVPKAVNEALCNLYTFTDYHLGMLAWHKEGGADWDLGIAETNLIRAFSTMIDQSPRAAKCVVNLQGDFLHSDGLLPVTPASKHVLDQDGRFSKIVGVAIRAIRQIISMALERHREVHLVIAEGNHDEASSVWLRLMFTALYDAEPRVTVNDSEIPYYVHMHGDVMLCFHHGHKVKNEQLPLLFAAQFPKEWGNTTKRFVHCGHRHHCDEKEYNGMTVIQHPTLAARDAYAARGGWIAERAAQAITYHSTFGQVGRSFVSPEMLAA